MPSALDFLQNVPFVGDTLNDISGKNGLETAARGAKEAQAQANALAQLQWQRQMAGLQEARGQTQPYLSLYDRIYGTQMAGHQTPVGGMGPGLGGPGAPGADPSGNPSPYAGLMRPDGTRGPTERVKPTGFGGGALAATSAPAFAPVMRGTPPGSAPPPPTGQPRLPSQNNGTDVITQYLMSLGAIR